MSNQNDELRQSYVRLLTALQVALPVIGRNSKFPPVWNAVFDVVVDERGVMDNITLSDGLDEADVLALTASQVQNNEPSAPPTPTPAATTRRRATKKTSDS